VEEGESFVQCHNVLRSVAVLLILLVTWFTLYYSGQERVFDYPKTRTCELYLIHCSTNLINVGSALLLVAVLLHIIRLSPPYFHAPHQVKQWFTVTVITLRKIIQPIESLDSFFTISYWWNSLPF